MGYGVAERLRRALLVEDWSVGIVDQSAPDIVARGLVGPVQWLTPPRPGAIIADPGCRPTPDGGLEIFAEMLDPRVDRGEIWRASFAADQAVAGVQFAPLMRAAVHLSYPFPFTDPQGGEWLTMESWQAGAAALWRWTGDAWLREGDLFAGRQVVDPTPWHDGTRWWLFCGFRDDGPDERLHVFHADRLGGPWTPHTANPVRITRRGSRPAGPLFHAAGQLIRPAQDSTASYGGALVLQAVRELTPDRYREEEIRHIPPPPGPYPSGIHTLCPAGHRTLIDGKRWRFSASALGAKMRRRTFDAITARG